MTTAASEQTEDRTVAAGFIQRTRQTMKAFTQAWDSGDIDGLMALFGDEPTYRTSSGTTFAGRPALRDGLVRMCQPQPPGGAPKTAAPDMQFFGRTCLAYWRLVLPNGDSKSLVDGVDVITFDDDARVVSKDAYRKLA